MIFYAISVVAISAIFVDTYSSQVQVKIFLFLKRDCYEFVRTFGGKAKCDEVDGSDTFFS